MEDNLQFKRTSKKDDFQWKTNFDGKQPLMEGEIQLKATLDGKERFEIPPQLHQCVWPNLNKQG